VAQLLAARGEEGGHRGRALRGDVGALLAPRSA
jgi:hypothetical protein